MTVFTAAGTIAIATVDSTGFATTPVFVANQNAGTYAVMAAIAGASVPFPLTNLPTACTFTVTQNFLPLTQQSGDGTITITPSDPSCAWGAASDSPWITFSESGVATGTGYLTTYIAGNNGGTDRTGSILVAGQLLTIVEPYTNQAFSDVTPNDYFFDAVNLLKSNGVTAGCSATDFCPFEIITRDQMAVFLVRSVMSGDDFTFSATPYFTDVPQNNPYFKWIQKLKELQITTGCGGTNFCPTRPVTREQAAAFIIRARYGPLASVGSPANPPFTDVPADDFAFADIQRLQADSITTGCSATQFCPGAEIIRGDMAIFIMRGEYNLALPGPNLPAIQALSTGTIAHGTSATITVTGENTHFAQGVTQINPIEGITISAITVTSPTSLTVQLTASGTASLRPVSVTAITGAEWATLPNRLVIQ